MSSDRFVSVFKPVYDRLIQAPRSVSEAVSMCHAVQDQFRLSTPRVYVSTAITSAGFKRDASLSIGEAIALNNESAALVLAQLAATDSPGIFVEEVMVPTELGKVPSWGDTDYLAFYFSWLSGLSVEGTAWLEGRLDDAVLAPVVSAANDRGRCNAERWPYYQKFVEVLLTTVATVSARRRGRTREASSVLLQLIDTSGSLGCRAEEMYAEVRGIDRIGITLGDALTEPLATRVARLRELDAAVGVARRQVQQIPVALR
jgi:hypothetical protein